MKIKFRNINVRILLIAMVFILGGCSGRSDEEVVTGQYYNPSSNSQNTEAGMEESLLEEGTKEEELEVIGTDLFIILENDMQAECLVLEQIVSGKQYMYYYTLSTRFLDKYGNRATVVSFDPGRIITIGSKDEQGRVEEVSISNQVWEYQDITRYSIDESRRVFKIADNKYSYEEELYVNSDGQRMKLSDLTDMDVIRVIGIGKKLLSVSITTGHGELELVNTDIFEGSFIQIGKKIFAEVSSNMTLEVPEGTYIVTVANKGYGGSTELTITRGETYVLDLDTIKGEGPKYGNILFAVDVEGAALVIDGKNVDYSKAVPLQYGVHSLMVKAEGFDTYRKNLFVNTSEATIVISLTGEGVLEGSPPADTPEEDTEENTEEENTEKETSESGNQAGSLAGSLAGRKTDGQGTSQGTASTENNGSAGNKEETSSDSTDKTTDYLTTLSELLSTLTDLQK